MRITDEGRRIKLDSALQLRVPQWQDAIRDRILADAILDGPAHNVSKIALRFITGLKYSGLCARNAMEQLLVIAWNDHLKSVE